MKHKPCDERRCSEEVVASQKHDLWECAKEYRSGTGEGVLVGAICHAEEKKRQHMPTFLAGYTFPVVNQHCVCISNVVTCLSTR